LTSNADSAASFTQPAGDVLHCFCTCRDVHKEFKKRGYSFEQLQAGLMVCRPCHSAIHRAVPDNKQLAMHYSTAEALSQVRGMCACVQGNSTACMQFNMCTVVCRY
jgi:hypothetical protein